MNYKGPLQLQKLDQSLAGKVVFVSEIFSSNQPMQSQNSKKHRHFFLLYPPKLSHPLPPPVFSVGEVPQGENHCRLQQQRRHHQPGSDQAFGVAEDPSEEECNMHFYSH